MLQFAPQALGGVSNPDAVYSPQRDLAHVFPVCVRYAVTHLSEDKRPDWIKAHCEDNGITEQQLADGLKCLIEAARSFHDAAKFPTEVEALEASGFTKMPNAVQHAIFSVIGRYFVAAFCSALRDLTIVGQNPAKASILAEIAERIDKAQSVLATRPEDSDAGDSPRVVREDV